MPDNPRIPKPTAQRLSLYLRELGNRAADKRPTVSSKQLGAAAGLTDAQVRKDLALFGQFGQPGVGYQVAALRERLREIVGTHQQWRAAIVGVGNIGRALLSYRRFRDEGFEISAVFDQSASLVGSRVGGLVVQPLSKLRETVQRDGISIGVIAVPPEAAQEVADALVAAGVRGILNFAPRRLDMRRGVPCVDVDFTSALQRLSFELGGTTMPAAPKPPATSPPAAPVRKAKRT